MWARLMAYVRLFKIRKAKEKKEKDTAQTQTEERLRDWINQLDVEADLLLAQRREASCDRQHRSS